MNSVMLIEDTCKGDGTKAWEELNKHYASTETPRMMQLWGTLNSVSYKPKEANITKYLLRPEYASNELNKANQEVPEGMLSSLILRGLPYEFQYFRNMQVMSKTRQSFAELEQLLMIFVESDLLSANAAKDKAAKKESIAYSTQHDSRSRGGGSSNRGRGRRQR
eukprot:GHVQ01028274.1.p1 GENE.GHVQ01028274.1~~GHVQ01028274.1.p1  ORF type:complete len:179 (+),score=11.41 GHVQ01028274.1:47-538(+)